MSLIARRLFKRSPADIRKEDSQPASGRGRRTNSQNVGVLHNLRSSAESGTGTRTQTLFCQRCSSLRTSRAPNSGWPMVLCTGPRVSREREREREGERERESETREKERIDREERERLRLHPATASSSVRAGPSSQEPEP